MKLTAGMRFHHVHSSAVHSKQNYSVVERDINQLGHGIVFTSQPINIGQRIRLRLIKTNIKCVGTLRVGLTIHDPKTLREENLPKFSCPDLSNREGFWVKALPATYARISDTVTFYVNSRGVLHYLVGGLHKGSLLAKLPSSRPMWMIFELFGDVIGLEFQSAEEAPAEIVARGPDAVQQFHSACEDGTEAVYRTRLMIVGGEGVGKSSLKNSLLGIKHSSREERTHGIDLSASCSFSLREKSSWKLAVSKGKPWLQSPHSPSPRKITPSEILEEEYNYAIASNIVQELLFKRRQNEQLISESNKNKEKYSQDLDITQTSTISLSHLDDVETSALLADVSERVATLVERLLAESGRTEEKSDDLDDDNVVLNIWDFAGGNAYYASHQIFLTPRAVYIVVFKLVDNEKDRQKVNTSVDYWLRMIHLYTAENSKTGDSSLSPPVFIVGTHRNQLADDEIKRTKIAEEEFSRIEEMVQSKHYANHIVPKYYAIDNDITNDKEIGNLKKHIEKVALNEEYMGEETPSRWLKIEGQLYEKVEEGVYFITFEQMKRIANEYEVESVEELYTLLHFLHDVGSILYFGSLSSLDSTLNSIIILQPQWLIDMFERLIDCNAYVSDVNEQYAAKLENQGILDERLINELWHDVGQQIPALLGLLEKFDLICRSVPSKAASLNGDSVKIGKSYIVPCKLPLSNTKLYNPLSTNDVRFYYDFNGFLPESVFNRILVRSIRWSQSSGSYSPKLFRRQARLYLDSEHDVCIEMHINDNPARITVAVIRTMDAEESADKQKAILQPKSTANAKIRNFLETTLSEIKGTWLRRLSYRCVVHCPCDKPCYYHGDSRCKQVQCMHFLDLDECLASKVVSCEHRRIKTAQFRKWFPAVVEERMGPILSKSITEDYELLKKHSEAKNTEVPQWVKSAAKLLNGGSEGQDWTSLGKKLGYKKSKMDRFNDDLNPGLALLLDWLISSGNTALSVDMIVSCLEQMKRDDIVDIVHKGQENDSPSPQVFISYEWESQDDVKAIRDRLEKCGFSCWMDIGQMGGGDQLYAKIDRGIRNCKVVLACISPRFIVSHYCQRELNLADLLRKPIVPVLIRSVPWPPPGSMALLLAQLVYIDLEGIGGHGGCGVHADLEEKYREIVQRISRHALPSHIRSPPPSEEDQDLDIPHSKVLIQEYRRPSRRTNSYNADEFRNSSEVGNRRTVEQVHIPRCTVCTIL